MKALSLASAALLSTFVLCHAGCRRGGHGMPAPEPGVRDLAWDGEYLWSVHVNSRKIYKIDRLGKPVKSVECPMPGPQGLTWDGSNLWVSTIGGSKIVKMNTEGEILAILQGPGEQPTGLAWGLGFLYYAESLCDIRKIDPNTGATLKTIDFPGAKNAGLAFDGSHLVLVEPSTQRIFTIDPETGKVLRQAELPRRNPFGVTWDGRKLWVSYPNEDLIEPVD